MNQTTQNQTLSPDFAMYRDLPEPTQLMLCPESTTHRFWTGRTWFVLTADPDPDRESRLVAVAGGSLALVLALVLAQGLCGRFGTGVFQGSRRLLLLLLWDAILLVNDAARFGASSVLSS